MPRIYLSATLGFWIIVGVLWAAGTWLEKEPRPSAAGLRIITAAELSQHARPDDCWMAIRGIVHDLTGFLPDHPAPPGIVEPWCGKDATEAYETKLEGRPHSAAADALLQGYRIGAFVEIRPSAETLHPRD